jgi:ABC-type transport system involved in multi-copper enzyme maturation permease subunit
MIWEVVKKELRSNITSPKVVITYCVCAVLILTSFFTGLVNYRSVIEEVESQTTIEKDRLRTIFNYQQDFMQGGVNIYRRPSVLSVLVNGVEGDAARRATMTTFVSPDFNVSRFNSTPILAIFGILDLEFIVKIILSLFAILFTFDAISGEKELGTLKLNLANPVKRSSFIVGKLFGTFLLLFIPFVIPVLIGLIIMLTYPGIVISGEDWYRIGLIMLSFFLYLLVFYSLGMMVSSLTKNSSISFLVLLMIWVVIIAVIPRAAVLVAQSLHPVPPVNEVIKDVIMKIGPAQRELQRSVMARANELQRDYVSQRPRPPIINTEEAKLRYEKQMQDWQKLGEQLREEFTQEVAEKFNDFTTRVRNESDVVIVEAGRKQDVQNDTAITLSRLASPAGALTLASNRLAKSGVYSADDVFKKNVRQAVQAFADANAGFLSEHREILLDGGFNQTEPLDVSEMYPDANNFRDESFSTSVNAVIIDFASLTILSIVFLAIAFVSFLRYDVR